LFSASLGGSFAGLNGSIGRSPCAERFFNFRTPDVALQFQPGGENGLSHSFRWRELRGWGAGEHRLPHLRAHCKFHDIRSSELLDAIGQYCRGESPVPTGKTPDDRQVLPRHFQCVGGVLLDVVELVLRNGVAAFLQQQAVASIEALERLLERLGIRAASRLGILQPSG